MNINRLQFLISQQILLHPKLEEQYLEELYQMARMGKVSLLPLTILNRYYTKLQRKKVA